MDDEIVKMPKKITDKTFIDIFQEKAEWKPEEVMGKFDAGKGTVYYHANNLLRQNAITATYSKQSLPGGRATKGRPAVQWSASNSYNVED